MPDIQVRGGTLEAVLAFLDTVKSQMDAVEHASELRAR